jgi:uncharacterized protein (TIGR02246 family)
MSESAERVVEAFVRAINRQDVEALYELMTREHRFVDSLGNAVEGRDKMRTGWKGYFGMVPDYTIAVEEVYCEGEVVVLLGEARGTYAPSGKLEAGNRWATPAAWRVHVEEGKVAEWRVYADNEPMRQCMARAGKRS